MVAFTMLLKIPPHRRSAERSPTGHWPTDRKAVSSLFKKRDLRSFQNFVSLKVKSAKSTQSHKSAVLFHYNLIRENIRRAAFTLMPLRQRAVLFSHHFDKPGVGI